MQPIRYAEIVDISLSLRVNASRSRPQYCYDLSGIFHAIAFQDHAPNESVVVF
ncbi:hypothetical protein RSSM_04486 [Rhodopirellula sallentina SM41]|uniref:Uncharacterized protein n=1 Tax=Rhodopirellula sallentina SM41 TaxID=1263870 RepID=M5U875_9BACT|nr:hypothetical protein RSSM_04486 [Rhodopirellula sallentina SM41]